MKYSLNIHNIDSNIFYTEYLLKKLITVNKHTLTNNDEADFILISICDITEIGYLKKLRQQYPAKKIIVGGHLAVFFKLLILFADYVNVGQGFEFFKCETENDIKKISSIYYKNKDISIIPSVLIEWELCPIVQLSCKRYSYWAAIGCKNKCSFCLTSWTNKQQTNNQHRIKKAYEAIRKGYSLKLIANEGYDNMDRKELVKDMLLTDFIKQDKINCPQIRIGVEFATEENRRKNGKAFTNEQFIQAVIRAREENILLQCFCIAGIDTKQQWIDFINMVPDYYKLSPKLVFKFTNLEYQMFTPMYKSRFDINIDNYLDGQFGKDIFEGNRLRMKNFKTFKVKYPAHSLWRTGLSACTNINEFNKIWELRNTKDINSVYKVINESGVLNNDYSDEVKFWYNN